VLLFPVAKVPFLEIEIYKALALLSHQVKDLFSEIEACEVQTHLPLLVKDLFPGVEGWRA
jgi:hypothetical protein